MNYPKISIVTPSFNQGKYIEKTIQSVLDQNYPNLEYIIIDGGSTDETIEIIKKYEDRIAFWVSEKDRGQSDALNKGFKRATGDIAGYINSDDYYEANVFEKIAKAFLNKDVNLLVGHCLIIKNSSLGQERILDTVGEMSFYRMLRYWQPFFCPPQPSVFFRLEELRRVGYFDETLNYAMDVDLWLKLSEKNKFHYFNEVLSYYLVHAESKTGQSTNYDIFRDEWRMLSFRYLKKASKFEQLKYWYNYFKCRFLSDRYRF